MPLFGYYIDIYYIILVIPAILFALIAQSAVSSTFKKYSRVGNMRGLTGAQAASEILRANGVNGVNIAQIQGNLTDHFDPKNSVIRLSDNVYSSTSVAAIGVACHEAGHAVQHEDGYFPIKLRTAIIPITNIGSKLAWPLIIVGFLFNSSFGQILVDIGIILFSTVALFQLVTLPVEFNASRRAIRVIEERGLLSPQEVPGAKRVLRAAAMTYVAALATAVAQLIRLILIAGNRRRD